jgi:hypothetical protein
MELSVTAGTRFYIGGPMELPSGDLNEASFNGQVWTEVSPIEGAGQIGGQHEEVSFDKVNTSTPNTLPRRVKLKGTFDAGSMELVFGLDLTDPGQLAVIDAANDKSDWAFKVDFNDAATPTKRLFVGLVMTATEVLDTANNVKKLNVTIARNSNIIRVASA